MSVMQSLIAQELELNGVRSNQFDWLLSKSITQECIRAIIPEVHEGKMFSSGIIFAENISELENIEVISLQNEQLEIARKMADGKEWFVLYEKDSFFGLARFNHSINNELQMIRNFPLTAGLIIQKESSGLAKFYQNNGIIIHENRRWFSKPNIKEAAWKVSKCVTNIDKIILSSILEFSFHLMSPTMRAGGVIVWQLGKINKVSSDLASLQLSIMNDSHSRLFCHLLSQVDGATFLDSKGLLMSTGEHLKYSEKSRKIVPACKGTRHTSSVRYSYDHEDVIVFTISEDGPVTVFSNGANIADLQIYSAFKKARLLKNKHPFNDIAVSGSSFEVICKSCEKKSMIEMVNLKGLDENKQLFCSTCKKLIYESICASLEGRSYKMLESDQ